MLTLYSCLFNSCHLPVFSSLWNTAQRFPGSQWHFFKMCYWCCYSQSCDLSKTLLCAKTDTFYFSYFSLRRCIVEPTGVKLIVRVLDELWGVEDRQDRAQCPSVPVVRHPASVVTLTGHVAEGIKWYFLQGNKTSVIFPRNNRTTMHQVCTFGSEHYKRRWALTNAGFSFVCVHDLLCCVD